MNKTAILISKDNTTTVRFSDEAGNVHLKPYDHRADAIRAIAQWQRPHSAPTAEPRR